VRGLGDRAGVRVCKQARDGVSVQGIMRQGGCARGLGDRAGVQGGECVRDLVMGQVCKGSHDRACVQGRVCKGSSDGARV